MKFVPIIEIDVPAVAVPGEKLEIDGAPEVAVTVNCVDGVKEPSGVVRIIEPVDAPEGTLVMMCAAVADVMTAEAPLNVTVFPVRELLNPVP